MLRQASPGIAPSALETRQAVVAGVGDGEERQAAPPGGTTLDFEPLPDRRGDNLAGQVKRVVRDGLPDGMTGRRARLEQPVRDDHPPRHRPIPTDVGAPGRRKHRSADARLGPNQERQATQVHPAERNIARLITQNLHTGVAGSGKVYWLISSGMRPIVGKRPG